MARKMKTENKSVLKRANFHHLKSRKGDVKEYYLGSNLREEKKILE